jgi:hypothetical protein
VKTSPPTLIFWFCVAVAVLLLAPYAGVHIISTPPPAVEPIDLTSTTVSHGAEAQGEVAVQDEQPAPFNPPESLQDIEGLLEEE